MNWGKEKIQLIGILLRLDCRTCYFRWLTGHFAEAEATIPLNHTLTDVLAHGYICKQKCKHMKHKGDILETENFFYLEHKLSKVNTEASLIAPRPCWMRKWVCQDNPLFTEHNLITYGLGWENHPASDLTSMCFLISQTIYFMFSLQVYAMTKNVFTKLQRNQDCCFYIYSMHT
jgi:hypothetical protein